MKEILRIAGISIVALIAGYAALAFALVYWPVNVYKGTTPAPVVAQREYPHKEQHFLMRDGKHLFARVFGAPSDTTIVLVHGFGVDSSAYQAPSSLWHQVTGARVIALDLRGHGRSDGRAGRTDYVGQYEDDIADVISSLRVIDSLRPGSPGRIILAGHSMGGGVVLSYVLRPHAPAVDAYLLFAPVLGSNAPTAPQTGGPATPTANLYVRTPRLMGVLMLALVHAHIPAFDDLPIMYLNQTPPMDYGVTAVASMGPRDYRAAFQAIRVPLLLIAGSSDEVFRGRAYVGVVKQYSRGQSVLIEGATHTSILGDPAAIAAIKGFVESLGKSGTAKSP